MTANHVAVIVINPEILKGETKDTYSNYFTNELYSLGLNLAKITYLSESENDLIHELILSLKQFDFIFLIANLEENFSNIIFRTSAKIFNEQLIPNCALTEIQGNDLTKPNIPATAKILNLKSDESCTQKIHPIIYLQRLFIIPNNQNMMDVIFQQIFKQCFVLFNSETQISTSVCLNCKEDDCNFVQEIKKRFPVDVSIKKNNENVTMKLVSSNLNVLFNAESAIKQSIKSDVLFCEEADSTFRNIYTQIIVLPRTKEAIDYIEECFATYGPENVFLSFNGGKDCTVLLHLVKTVLRCKYPNFKKPIYCLYVQTPTSFKEVDDFIAQVEMDYNLKVITYVDSIKNALNSVLKTEPNMKACLLGTRRTDPYAHEMQIFQMTDADWPQVMRVCPILDWHYSEIWDYLLFFKVPYCTLYDQGYTSLGSINNTVRNPELYCCHLDSTKNYLPAYKLLDGSKERSGRCK